MREDERTGAEDGPSKRKSRGFHGAILERAPFAVHRSSLAANLPPTPSYSLAEWLGSALRCSLSP